MGLISKIFGGRGLELEQRDEMYSLNREGLSVDPADLNGRVSRLDRSHIFEDGTGEIIPASKLRARDGGIGRIQGRTIKQGPIHSHDQHHKYHLLEVMPNPQEDLVSRFRKKVQNHRNERRESRDR